MMLPKRYHYGIARMANTRHGFKIIKYCQGTGPNGPFYAFLAIEPQNFSYFEDHYKADTLSDFSAFGLMLFRGHGLGPSRDILDHLQSKYDIQFGADVTSISALIDKSFHSEQPDQERAQKPSSLFLSIFPKYPEKPAEAKGL